MSKCPFCGKGKENHSLVYKQTKKGIDVDIYCIMNELKVVR